MIRKLTVLLGIAAFAGIIALASLVYNKLDVESGGAALVIESAAVKAPLDESIAPIETIAADKAPDFTVFNEDGEAVRLSDFFGKPIVMNFWASWCPPCKSEMPEFDDVFLELGDDIQFMMVDLTDGGRETVESGAAYVAEMGFSFPVFFDNNQEAAYAYGIRSIPTTIFIDADGVIVTGAQGAINRATLEKGISMIR